MNRFTIQIASLPDREKLVAEIWHAETHIAEINQENDYLEIEFYQLEKAKFSLDELMEVLNLAKAKLTGNE